MTEQVFRMSYLGTPMGHSKLIDVYNSCCESVNLIPEINLFDVNKEEFIEKIIEIKQDKHTNICITLPHKIEAYKQCDQLTERAKKASSVNVIYNREGTLIGDNTDGIGFIRSAKNNFNIQFKDQKILLLGTGGVSRGLLGAIYDESPQVIDVAGRSLVKLTDMKSQFGDIIHHTHLLKDLSNQVYDIIINATSSSINKTSLQLSSNLINENTICLECAYNWSGDTPFGEFCKNNGAQRVYGGSSMLIEQAIVAMDFFKGIPVNSSDIHNRLDRNL